VFQVGDQVPPSNLAFIFLTSIPSFALARIFAFLPDGHSFLCPRPHPSLLTAFPSFALARIFVYLASNTSIVTVAFFLLWSLNLNKSTYKETKEPCWALLYF
jgi:hypothetical protein